MKKQLIKSSKSVNAGTSKEAAASRRVAFAQAYTSNGRNGTKAAIAAGFSERTASAAASRLLRDVKVSTLVGEVSAIAEEITGLTAERTLRETGRISNIDPAKLFHADGTLKNIYEMDADTRAAIASFEVEETKVDGVAVGRTIKVKFWDKNRALDMSMKNLGLYERDNSQRGDSLALQVVLVGAK